MFVDPVHLHFICAGSPGLPLQTRLKLTSISLWNVGEISVKFDALIFFQSGYCGFIIWNSLDSKRELQAWPVSQSYVAIFILIDGVWNLKKEQHKLILVNLIL